MTVCERQPKILEKIEGHLSVDWKKKLKNNLHEKETTLEEHKKEVEKILRRKRSTKRKLEIRNHRK